jgi:iron complex outermembrane receptor protein
MEGRRETLDDVRMPIAFDVLQNLPTSPKQGSRHVQAAYAEIVAPVLKGLELQVAGRVDHYSDFGTAFSPKLAIRFEPRSGVLLRASIGRGFRAPSLNELFAEQRHSFLELSTRNVSDPVRCPVTRLASDCGPAVDVVTGGNPALQPQRSTQSNLGIVVSPAAGWLASLDLWRIHIDSNITTIDTNVIINRLAFFDNGRNVQRGPADPAFPNLPGPIVAIEALNENLGEWRVSGADVSLQTPKPATEIGRIWARVDATYVDYARQKFSTTTFEQVGAISPRWQSVASINLDRDHWIATLLYRYRHGYNDIILLPDGTPHHVPAYQLWDANAVFTIARNVKLLLGVQNLLNTAPPLSTIGDPLLGYDPSYADPRGRRWTVGLRASWT